MKTFYFDNGASTQTDPKVVKAMLPFFTEHYANPSSSHESGQEAKRALENARVIIAKSIKAKPEEIIFTSGGTESNNLTLKGIAWANRAHGNHLITTQIEHDCVLETSEWLETQGFKITYLPVNSEGFVNPADLEKAITPKTILVSIIHANNEIGTLQDLTKLGQICRKHNVYFHTDACQSYTKTPIDVRKQNLDLVTLNSHKIHGPKGVGALYIHPSVKITPWTHGGNHENGLRSGTENVSGIVGFAKAAKLGLKKRHVKHMLKLRDQLIQGILKNIPGTLLNGPQGSSRLCNNINIAFPIDASLLGDYLNSKGICVSKGSACSNINNKPSHVLTAIGRKKEATRSLRLTISRFTTPSEIKFVLDTLIKLNRKLSN